MNNEFVINRELIFTENGRMYEIRHAAEKFLEMEVRIEFLTAEEAEDMMHRWFPKDDE